ncbi:MAG: hypothetical protein H0T59_00940 [Chloroflexi bacterium]|nr:hypothetical protein [Chloroflexota bacterium]
MRSRARRRARVGSLDQFSLAHAGGASASVVIRYGVDHLGLEIADTGSVVRGASVLAYESGLVRPGGED